MDIRTMAKELGITAYEAESPCNQCGGILRYTKDGRCKTCHLTRYMAPTRSGRRREPRGAVLTRAEYKGRIDSNSLMAYWLARPWVIDGEEITK